MSREILLLVEALASEKNVSEDVVFSALEYALAGAAKKQHGHDGMDVRVEIDKDTGKYEAFRRWLIVADEDYTYPDVEKTIEEIQEDIPGTGLAVGEYYEEPIEAEGFGRIGAQTAKQLILQRIRDAEREKILADFLANQDSLVLGTVKRVEHRRNAIIEVGRLEAILPFDQMIPRESLRAGDRVRALFLKVEQQGNRSVVVLTRTSKEFLRKLFELEVPEIEDGLLEIKEVARDPGIRAKIAVKSNDARIDPQGTCIGVRGSRVNAVSNELSGERIDVVLWSPETAQFVINTLSPASVSRILIDEDNHSVDVIVEEDQLALAIGRNGQNVRLAAELTGWNLNIMTVEEADQRDNAEDRALHQLFESGLSVDAEVADILVMEGFASLEEVAYVPLEEMLEIEGFDTELVEGLRTRAREALQEKEEKETEILAQAESDLVAVKGLDKDTLLKLIAASIVTRDDLAELSVDELVDITGIGNNQGKEIIMDARAHWFTEAEGGQDE